MFKCCRPIINVTTYSIKNVWYYYCILPVYLGRLPLLMTSQLIIKKKWYHYWYLLLIEYWFESVWLDHFPDPRIELNCSSVKFLDQGLNLHRVENQTDQVCSGLWVPKTNLVPLLGSFVLTITCQDWTNCLLEFTWFLLVFGGESHYFWGTLG